MEHCAVFLFKLLNNHFVTRSQSYLKAIFTVIIPGIEIMFLNPLDRKWGYWSSINCGSESGTD